MARRYRSRYTRKSHTLILILVSAIALLAAWGLWMAWSAIREYQASRDAYDEIILETADRYGVDPALVKAVIWRESRFPNRGALFTPRLNIEIGTWYLGNALRRWSSYEDRLVLALCEYNAGIRRANAWKPNEKNGSVRERITIASTRSYVDAVLDQYEDYKKSWQKKYPLKGNR